MVPELIPIFGMVTGIITTGLFFWGVVRLAQSPVGQALARRIQGRSDGVPHEVLQEMAALREQVDAMQEQLVETQERLDFTERLLTQGRATEPPREVR